MKTWKPGRTDLDLPIVGLGAAFVGIPTPNSAAQENEDEPGGMENEFGIATIHQAIEAGSTLSDTAPIYGRTRTVAAALQWCTQHPRIAATIPGARTPDEALANAQAGEVHIPDDFWEDLAPLVRHFEIEIDR